MAYVLVEQEVDLSQIILKTFFKQTSQSIAEIHKALRQDGVQYVYSELETALNGLSCNWTTLDQQEYRLKIGVVEDIHFRLISK